MTAPRILVVDDEDDIRTVIRASLSSKYEIVEAIDGLDALQKLELAEPDFVILDVMMPLMDGLSACRSIRDNPKYADMPVLFLTALNSREDIMKGYDVGANLYLTKPFEPARLLRNVEAFFSNNRATFHTKKYSLTELQTMHAEGPASIAEAHVRAVAAEQPRPASTSGGQSTTVGHPRVLIVDSDTDLVKHMKELLKDRYEVFTAGDGMEAIGKITSFQPDLILLESVIPRMSGYQLCQSIRKNPRFANTPIAFVSGKNTSRDKEYAARIGATAFLAKPYQDAELVQLMGQLQAAPGFKVFPKVLSAEQILERQWKEEEAHRIRQNAGKEKEESELEKFLREHSGD